MFLVIELLHEVTPLIQLFQVLDQTDFFTAVDALVILKKFPNNLLKHVLLGLLICLRNEFSLLGWSIVFTCIDVKRLVGKDFLKELQLLSFLILPICFIFLGIDPNRVPEGLSHILNASEEM